MSSSDNKALNDIKIEIDRYDYSGGSADSYVWMRVCETDCGSGFYTFGKSGTKLRVKVLNNSTSTKDVHITAIHVYSSANLITNLPNKSSVQTTPGINFRASSSATSDCT